VFSRPCYSAVRLVLCIGNVRLGKREIYPVHSLAGNIHEYLLSSGVEHEEMVVAVELFASREGQAEREGTEVTEA
jgi:hypothetical protein